MVDRLHYFFDAPSFRLRNHRTIVLDDRKLADLGESCDLALVDIGQGADNRYPSTEVVSPESHSLQSSRGKQIEQRRMGKVFHVMPQRDFVALMRLSKFKESLAAVSTASLAVHR